MQAATATEAAPIQLTTMIDEPPTAIPPMPAPAAKPSCTKELFRLSIIPEASGASETMLKLWVSPNVHAEVAQSIINI